MNFGDSMNSGDSILNSWELSILSPEFLVKEFYKINPLTADENFDIADTFLYELGDGNYLLKAYVSEAFKFVDDTGSDVWSSKTKMAFVESYEAGVESVWDGKIVGTHNGHNIIFDADVKSSFGTSHRLGGWLTEVVATSNTTSSRATHRYKSDLSHVDQRMGRQVLYVKKDASPYYARTSGKFNVFAHEFGHILGLPDEYHFNRISEYRPFGERGSAFVKAVRGDFGSIMNGDGVTSVSNGGNVRSRHVDLLRDWSVSVIASGKRR